MNNSILYSILDTINYECWEDEDYYDEDRLEDIHSKIQRYLRDERDRYDLTFADHLELKYKCRRSDIRNEWRVT